MDPESSSGRRGGRWIVILSPVQDDEAGYGLYLEPSSGRRECGAAYLIAGRLSLLMVDLLFGTPLQSWSSYCLMYESGT